MLRRLPPPRDRRVLVGPATGDDAAVYRLDAGRALVATTDFFTPVVDDPFVFGRIAGANALSDVYAMGARPLFALSLVSFPASQPLELLGRMLEGLADACTEAGIEIVGGHCIDDPEPKLGLAVTGIVHPRGVLSNDQARAGDMLVLTKPLGSGIATTAIKRGLDSPACAAAVEAMSRLNRAAGEVFASRLAVHALTDVTGFGLLGHLLNLVRGSELGAALYASEVPVLPGVEDLARAGVVPGGTVRNLEDVSAQVRFPADMPEWRRWILADAQTNGGLLACVARRDAAAVLRALKRRGVTGAVVGRLHRGEPVVQVE